MSHVDDGTLHALLDGALQAEEPDRARSVEAHLEACADCRARLDHAAAVRDRAGNVLGLIDPDPRPDFQEVLTRAGRAGRAGHDRRHDLARRSRRTRGAAWAATIVLALGTGYLVRDRLVPDPPTSDAITPRAMETSAETRGDAGPAISDAEDRPERAPATAQADRARPSESGAAATPTAPPAAPPVESPSPAEAGRLADAEIELDAVVTTGAPAGRMATPERAAAFRAGEARATGVSETAPALVTPLAGQLHMDGREWRAVDLEEARGLMDGHLYRLPDAEILETLAHGADEHVEVRTRQRLPGGAEVLVTQRRADADDTAQPLARIAAHPSAPEAARVEVADAPGIRVVRVVRSRHWLTLQGSLPVAVLEALAASAEIVTEP